MGIGACDGVAGAEAGRNATGFWAAELLRDRGPGAARGVAAGAIIDAFADGGGGGGVGRVHWGRLFCCEVLILPLTGVDLEVVISSCVFAFLAICSVELDRARRENIRPNLPCGFAFVWAAGRTFAGAAGGTAGAVSPGGPERERQPMAEANDNDVTHPQTRSRSSLECSTRRHQNGHEASLCFRSGSS